MRGLQRFWAKVSSCSSRTASKSNSLAFPGCGGGKHVSPNVTCSHSVTRGEPTTMVVELRDGYNLGTPRKDGWGRGWSAKPIASPPSGPQLSLPKASKLIHPLN